ncbi:MAG: O-methyltransferase [Thermoleophilaceae bacterium]
MDEEATLVRRARAAFARRAATPNGLPDLAHLGLFSETPHGPVQRDEALLLYSLVRVIRPRTIVEIGFQYGRSSLNFLKALDDDGRLYSFDVDPECERRAREKFGDDPRFAFRLCSQDAITSDYIDGRQADLVFLDASHDLELNQRTFERLLPLISDRGIVAVHDTGTVPRELVPSGHWWLESEQGWVGDEREVLPDERTFVNWIVEQNAGFAEIHLHSQRTLRLGLTLIQRSAPLARPQSAPSPAGAR